MSPGYIGPHRPRVLPGAFALFGGTASVFRHNRARARPHAEGAPVHRDVGAQHDLMDVSRDIAGVGGEGKNAGAADRLVREARRCQAVEVVLDPEAHVAHGRLERHVFDAGADGPTGGVARVAAEEGRGRSTEDICRLAADLATGPTALHVPEGAVPGVTERSGPGDERLDGGLMMDVEAARNADAGIDARGTGRGVV